MNPISFSYTHTYPIVSSLQGRDIFDLREFQNQVALANENRKKWGFLELTSVPFSDNPENYTEMELEIILDRRERFSQCYKQHCFDRAFAVAFFFWRTEILVFLFEKETVHREKMIECLLNVRGFDFLSTFDLTRRVSLKNKILQQSKKIALFENSSFNDQVKTLKEMLESPKSFCNFWNRASREVQSCVFPDGNSWLHTAIIKKKWIVIDHLIANDGVKFFNFLTGQTALETAQYYLDGFKSTEEMSRMDENFTNQMIAYKTMGHRFKMILAEPFSSSQEMGKSNWEQLVHSLIASMSNFLRYSSFFDDLQEIEQSLLSSTKTRKDKCDSEFLHEIVKHWTVIKSNRFDSFITYIVRVNQVDKRNPSVPRNAWIVKVDTTSSGYSKLGFYYSGQVTKFNLTSALEDIFAHLNKPLLQSEEISFQEKLDQKLGLQHIVEIPVQTEENSAWVTLKTTFLALLIIQATKKQNKLPDADIFLSAFNMVKPVFQMWEEEDLLQSMHSLDALLSRTWFLDKKTIFSHLMIKCIRQNFELAILKLYAMDPTCLNTLCKMYVEKVLDKSWLERLIIIYTKRGLEIPIFKLLEIENTLATTKDENGRTLVRYAYEKGLAGLFLHLYRNADWTEKDIINTNLADDVHANPVFLQEIFDSEHVHYLPEKVILSLKKLLPSKD